MLLSLLLAACGLDDKDDGPDPVACECDPVVTNDTVTTLPTETTTTPCDTAAGDTGCDTGSPTGG